MSEGVDYASVDGNAPPDVRAMHGSGIRFVIVRGAFPNRGIMCTDTDLARDRGPMKQAGFAFASYLILGYNPAGPSPEDQARAFISAYGPRRAGEMCPWLDVEFSQGRAATGLTASAALAWIERAYAVLVAYYGIVGTYTSARVWTDDLADLPSSLGSGPLWLKVPYPYKAGQPPHPEAFPKSIGTLPMPWRGTKSPGAWIVQYQGDAKGAPGFSSTVDLNRFLPFVGAVPDLRYMWVASQLARLGFGTVTDMQRARGLGADSVCGPFTFAVLTA